MYIVTRKICICLGTQVYKQKDLATGNLTAACLRTKCMYKALKTLWKMWNYNGRVVGNVLSWSEWIAQKIWKENKQKENEEISQLQNKLAKTHWNGKVKQLRTKIKADKSVGKNRVVLEKS